MEESKRQLLKAIGAGALYLPLSQLYVAESLATTASKLSLFQKIYSDQALAKAFNAYLLNNHAYYMDPQLPNTIMELTSLYQDDQTIYEHLQNNFFTQERNGLSAIHQAHHEQEYEAKVTIKSRELIDKDSTTTVFNDHLNLATSHTYVDQLRQQLPILGQSILLTDNQSVNPIFDMFTSEQSSYSSQTLALNQYQPLAVNAIKPESVDLITQFYTHNSCPEIHQRTFMRALLSRLKVGGHLIIQLPDIRSQLDGELATLSHYLTSLQTGFSWQENLMHKPSLQSIRSWKRQLRQYGMTFKNGQEILKSNFLPSTLLHFNKTA